MQAQPKPGASGHEIFSVSDCASCHGEHLAGTSMGPSLTSLREHWTDENLADYLSHPAAWIARDSRLKKLDDDFWFSMPDFDNLSDLERMRLANWLLKQG